ncbi:hypothetical protein T492DRAFT_964514 [Pavlovales sp. CCMP2436]|nr:hypothetical protein T492DRAFT_964514 [Pavlovales sp. CCMP2436]
MPKVGKAVEAGDCSRWPRGTGGVKAPAAAVALGCVAYALLEGWTVRPSSESNRLVSCGKAAKTAVALPDKSMSSAIADTMGRFGRVSFLMTLTWRGKAKKDMPSFDPCWTPTCKSRKRAELWVVHLCEHLDDRTAFNAAEGVLHVRLNGRGIWVVAEVDCGAEHGHADAGLYSDRDLLGPNDGGDLTAHPLVHHRLSEHPSEAASHADRAEAAVLLVQGDVADGSREVVEPAR